MMCRKKASASPKSGENVDFGGDEFQNKSLNSCSEGYFQCHNSTICIPQIENCDGKFDCENGSDEWDCADEEGSKYWDHLFRKNPSAEHEDLDQKCVLNYNGTCICRSRVILCQHMGLKKPPDDLPRAQVDLLDFSGNSFGAITPILLKSIPHQLSSLVLRQCSITELHQRSFSKLSNLKSLYLDSNDLIFFPANVFPKRNELTSLIIRRNKLNYVDVDAFRYLTGLLELPISKKIERKIIEPKTKPKKQKRMGSESGESSEDEDAIYLYLNANKIKVVTTTTFPPMSLITLSLAENFLESLDLGTFSSAPTLKNLFLSDNRIHVLSRGIFRSLDNLVSLNLHGNGINSIEMGVFEDVRNLTSLYLGKNAFRRLPKDLLQPLDKLQYIYFDRFEMCLTASHVRVCEPKGDGISSQEHLLDNPVLRTILLGRLIAPTNNVVHSLYIRNLALSDLLMGIYLFTIASADHHYRGEYIQHEYDWRHSTLCNICGFLSTLSCESSVLILSLVTWDRFISVTQPLARKQPSAKAALVTLVFLWIVAVIVAAAPLSTIADNYFGDEFYGSNGVCLSLHIHDPYDKGWEYSAAMFVFVNTIALVFICYAYCRMIREIRASTIACRSTRQSQDRDKVAQRFGVIILTDCLCWVPVICVKLAALSAILVLPINSALNPILYTLTTTVFIKQMQKIVNARIFKKKRSERHGSDSAHSTSFLQRGNGSRLSFFYRGNQSSLNTTRTSWKQSTAV
ncbi:hypothetical protein RN001_004052 [Aquatica leii]|uniref:G-protein coupled receptors family 1 profile domain-containing protein n=1 Tax=Aquatica leii TaxID=1421715 RepID=A0AAN7PRT0_9COLE|nr:hypothetical protein RN001_004052 [Aquatica leii]